MSEVIPLTTQRLSAAETAARLGVKPETLYAYVSRGLLSRQRGPAGSTFDPLEVERFAAARRRGGRAPVLIKNGRPSGGPLMTIDTDVALIEDDALYYRGRSATELARTTAFEQVCWEIWAGRADVADRGGSGLGDHSRQPESDDQDRRRGVELGAGGDVDPVVAGFTPLPGAVEAARRVLRELPVGASSTDRIRVAVPVVAAVDPLREVLEPESVIRRAGALIGTLAAVVGESDPGDDHRSAAARLVPARFVGEDRAAHMMIINAALVLLLDHDLAASTLAARAAASARANPYAVVSSGLGALDSALHGNASRSAYRMLAAVCDGDPARTVIARTIASGRLGVPGFGHRIYRRVDPRAELIFALLAELPGSEPVLQAAAAVTEVVTADGAGFRNVDLALAAYALISGMPADAGEMIFAIARIGGWVAHALDEYSQPALRLRPVGRYVGP